MDDITDDEARDPLPGDDAGPDWDDDEEYSPRC
jgi:hypothetical protein